jgi:hypothetical protein
MNPPIENWEFYMSVAAEASATLTGLVFVAVSINLARIIEIPGLSGLAAESMARFLGVVFISLAALIPGQSLTTLGREVVFLDVALWLIQTQLQVAYFRSKTGHPWQWAARRVVRTFAACLPFLIGGVLMSLGGKAGAYWMTPGVFFSVIAGVANAWVLLVEVVR